MRGRWIVLGPCVLMWLYILGLGLTGCEQPVPMTIGIDTESEPGTPEVPESVCILARVPDSKAYSYTSGTRRVEMGIETKLTIAEGERPTRVITTVRAVLLDDKRTVDVRGNSMSPLILELPKGSGTINKAGDVEEVRKPVRVPAGEFRLLLQLTAPFRSAGRESRAIAGSQPAE